MISANPKTDVSLTAANHSHLSATLRDYADELFEVRSSLAALAMNADEHKDVILSRDSVSSNRLSARSAH